MRAGVMAHAIIPGLGRLRQGDHSEFQVGLSYTVKAGASGACRNSKHVKVEAGGFQVPSRLGLYRETLSKDNQKHTIKKGYVCGMCVARISYKKTGFISGSVCHFFWCLR